MKVNRIIFAIPLIFLVVFCWALLTLEQKGTAMERKGIVTFKGNGLTLTGQEVKVGQKAPDFEVVDNKLGAVKFSDFKGSVCIITSVPSLDTPVCDTETRRFNEEASKLGTNVKVLTISLDLPFAQARWCGAAGIKNLTTLSDYKTGDFGNNYGVLIKELKLLARAVFVVDSQGIIRYVQIVPEIASEPNYDDVIASVKKLTK